jgi:hypothetical protein
MNFAAGRRFVLYSLFSLGLCAVASLTASAQSPESWSSFRGSNGNGVAADATPPTKWSADSENLKWKTAIPGKASSSPIVWGDKVFVMTAVDTMKTADGKAVEQTPEAEGGRGGRGGGRGGRGGGGRGGRGGRGGPSGPTSVQEFWVLCVDRNDGSVTWKTKVNEVAPHEGKHSTNSFCSGSPVTDGKHIYASFGSFGLYCLDMEGGVVWKRNLGKMSTRNSFGEGSSPAIYKDKLAVIWDHEGDSFLEIMNAGNGETIWKKDRANPTGWTTPVFVEHNDKVQVIINATKVQSYDLADGAIIWECGGQTGNPIPTPMVADGFVVCMTGWRSSACYAISLDSEGDVEGSDKVLWNSREIGPYVPTGVLYEGHVYGTKSRGAILVVVDAKTGEEVVSGKRLDGINSLYASMVAANGHVYVTDRGGVTAVLEHGNEANVVSTNDLGEPVDATPAIVGNQILIRGSNHLFCFEN